MTAVTITVLQDDIDHGLRFNSVRCPVALAVRREMPGITNVSVWDENMVAWRRDDAGTISARDIPLPGEARSFIRRFDQRVPVEPFKFEITVE